MRRICVVIRRQGRKNEEEQCCDQETEEEQCCNEETEEKK